MARRIGATDNKTALQSRSFLAPIPPPWLAINWHRVTLREDLLCKFQNCFFLGVTGCANDGKFSRALGIYIYCFFSVRCVCDAP